MSKLYTLVKVTWGDFDSKHETVIAVSAFKDKILDTAERMNAKRKPDEVENECGDYKVRYELGSNMVNHL
jgi:hypothetical protein